MAIHFYKLTIAPAISVAVVDTIASDMVEDLAATAVPVPTPMRVVAATAAVAGRKYPRLARSLPVTTGIVASIFSPVAAPIPSLRGIAPAAARFIVDAKRAIPEPPPS